MKYYEIEFTIKSCNKSNAFLTDGEEELLMENVKDVVYQRMRDGLFALESIIATQHLTILKQ